MHRTILLPQVLFLFFCASPWAAEPCERLGFETIVASASANITTINQDNTKRFQEKLGQLRQVKNWSDADYIANATPFVSDDVTKSLDTASQGLLDKVKSLNAAANTSDCVAITRELQHAMDGVVQNTKQKWQHLMEKASLALNGAAK